MTTTTDARTATGNDAGIDAGNGAQTVDATAATPTSDASPVQVGGAVWDALCANPGASVAAIATAAGVPVTTARRALVALEAAGHATRIPGGRRDGKRAPDTWHPAPTTDTPASDAATPDATSTDATDTGPETTEVIGETGTGTPADVTVASDDTAVGGATSGGDGDVGTDPANVPPGGGTIRAHIDDREGEEEGMDPAAVTEARVALTGLGEAIASALSALQAGDREAALTAAETFYSASGKGRRLVRAAVQRRARGASGVAHSAPGQLRTKVAAHLAAHPGKEFTPHEIGKVIGHSAGAIANALDRLAALGQAIETCERPRRFTATDHTTAATTGATAGTATA